MNLRLKPRVCSVMWKKVSPSHEIPTVLPTREGRPNPCKLRVAPLGRAHFCIHSITTHYTAIDAPGSVSANSDTSRPQHARLLHDGEPPISAACGASSPIRPPSDRLTIRTTQLCYSSSQSSHGQQVASTGRASTRGCDASWWSGCRPKHGRHSPRAKQESTGQGREGQKETRDTGRRLHCAEHRLICIFAERQLPRPIANIRPSPQAPVP